MKTKLMALSGSLFFLTLIFSSCNLNDFQDIDEINYEAEFALPLVNTSVTIQDFLDRSTSDLSFLTIEEDGSFTLSYEEEANILQGEELLSSIPGSFPIPVPSQNTTVPLSEIEDVKISSANFKSGTLQFELSSNLAEDLEVSIRFPGITKNSQPLEIVVDLDYQGSLPVQNNSNAVNLSDYQINTNNGDLEITYEALNDNNQSRTVDVVLGTANNWAFDNIVGDWSQLNYQVDVDTLAIDLYNSNTEGELYFSNPQLNILFNNSFGVPIFVKFKQISVLTIDNQIIPFSADIMNGGILVDAPNINQQGQSVMREFTFDKSNSNIDVVFNSKPAQIWYEVELQVAPNSGGGEGFILDESKIDLQLSFDLPIEGTAKGFVTENIVDIDLGAEEGDALKEAQLKLITANEIPFDAGLQLFFLDNNGEEVEALFSSTQEVVAANSPAITTFFDLTPARLDNIRQSKKIKIRTEFSTQDNGNTPVIIRNNQELEIKLGIRATIVQ